MWELQWIEEQDFINHVKSTIEKYEQNLESYDVEKFNSNIVDPIKLLFDSMVYRSSWKDTVKNEILRQRDKSNNNSIGYFHQKIFNHISGCTVPNDGWDVVVELPGGLSVSEGNQVKTVYVEMKNKHNTMNSSASAKTYIKMQHQLLEDDDCACFLVEAIATKSQNIPWRTTVDGQQLSHRLIRRVSLDNFYSMVTGDPNAFYNMCMVLPRVIQEIVDGSDVAIPEDSVIEEIKNNAESKDVPLIVAFYLLGFSSYLGFKDI